MTKKKVNEKHTAELISLGVILYVLRYVPLASIRVLHIDNKLSLSQLANTCNLLIGGAFTNCTIVSIVNVLQIFISVGLIAYAIYEHVKFDIKSK